MILWLNPFSGISGDMLLGALLHLGAPLDDVRAAVASTGLTGWELTAEPARRAGLAACRARVRVDEEVPERRAADLLTLARAAVPAAAAELAATAIAALGEVEGRIHGVPAADVYLHELGGVDTIVDTVGVAAALHALRVKTVWSAPLALGAGVIEMRHGHFPAPAPATVALLEGAQVTGVHPTDGAAAGETVTPTGAALLRAAGCRYGPMPAMRVSGQRVRGRRPGRAGTAQRPACPAGRACGGSGAGGGGGGRVPRWHRDADHGRDHGGRRDRRTARRPARPAARRGRAGRLDHRGDRQEGPPRTSSPRCAARARTSRSRRGCSPRRAAWARGAIAVQRSALPRREAEVTVQGHRIRVKIGPHRAKPEHDDVAAAALATGLPRRVVAEQALSQLEHDPGQGVEP